MLSDELRNELEKQGAPFLLSLGKLLAKGIPTAAMAVKNFATAAGVVPKNVRAVQAAGGLIGGAGGAYAGASSAPEGQKGKGALIGGALGAFGGALGGKALATRVPTLGRNTIRASVPVGKAFMANPSMKVTDAAELLSKHWTRQVNAVGEAGVTAKPFFGMAKETPAIGQVTKKPPMLFRAFGEAARGVTAFNEKGVAGIGNILKENIRESKHFTKRIGGKDYLFRRSVPGRVLGPLFGSGVGFGVLDASTATDEYGNPQSVGKRVLKGGKTALQWGVTPTVMTGKLLAYDIPKQLL